MFEETAKTSGSGSSLVVTGQSQSLGNPAVLGFCWAMGELAEHREVLMEVVTLLVPSLCLSTEQQTRLPLCLRSWLGSCSLDFSIPGQRFHAPDPPLLKKHLFPSLLLGHLELALLTPFHTRCSTPQKFCTPNTGSWIVRNSRHATEEQFSPLHIVLGFLHCLNITFRKQQDIFLPKIVPPLWPVKFGSVGFRSYSNKTPFFWHTKRINAALQGSWLNQDVNE